jgi:hypothetical protein
MLSTDVPITPPALDPDSVLTTVVSTVCLSWFDRALTLLISLLIISVRLETLYFTSPVLCPVFSTETISL